MSLIQRKKMKKVLTILFYVTTFHLFSMERNRFFQRVDSKFQNLQRLVVILRKCMPRSLMITDNYENLKQKKD